MRIDIPRLRILILDDSVFDFELVQVELMSGGMDAECFHATHEASYLAALDSFLPDVILADYNVPGFGGAAALEIRNRRAAGIPFILVSGSIGDERAADILRGGATDFVLKDRMARLVPAIHRALDDFAQQRERARIATELNAERLLLQATLNTAQALIVVVDGNGNVMHLNPVAEQSIGQPLQLLRQRPFWEVFPAPEGLEAARVQVRSALEWNSPLPMRSWSMITHGGRRIVWSCGSLALGQRAERLVLSGIDVSELERAEAHAFYLGHYDTLTGLPNRKLFLRQLGEYRERREVASETTLVVMMLGLARVQEIGDSYGDAVINQILVALVERLRCLPLPGAMLARVSDSAFACAFEHATGPELEGMLPTMLDALQAPVTVDGRPWQLPLRSGIARYPEDAQEPYLLLQAAEAALHCAEAESVQRYAFYTPMLSDQARERLQLESELREALQRPDQLVMYYQPQVALGSGRLVGMESLIRWQHPTLGWMPPNRFIPLAEVCGLMSELGRWVLRSVCGQLQAWQRAGIRAPTVAVNLSASQFSASQLEADIGDALREFAIDPGLLELELTESTSMRDPQTSIGIMTRLRGMGLTLSIDDFGTGYSNLAYLKRFPVNRLKLDQAFVRDITHDEDDLAISRAIIAMAHLLRLEVIAEGVETQSQLSLLAALDCDIAQGYFHSRPVPADLCAELIPRAFSVPSRAPA